MPLGDSARLARRQCPALPAACASGRLAEFHVLDTRQYRSDQPCGGALDQLPPPGTTSLRLRGETFGTDADDDGRRAGGLAARGLQRSRRRLERDRPAGDDGPGRTSPDRPRSPRLQHGRLGRLRGGPQPAARLRARRGIDNVVVLTGDIHSSWVADLRADFDDPRSPGGGHGARRARRSARAFRPSSRRPSRPR